jgi:large repetitive protein
VAAQVSDVDAIDPPDTMTANYTFTFITQAPPPVDTAPSVANTIPVNGTGSVPVNTTIAITFSESVNVDTVTFNSFTITCPATQTYTIAGSGTNIITLTPSANLPGTATCMVTVVATQVSDVDAIDPPDTMMANYVFNFTTP